MAFGASVGHRRRHQYPIGSGVGPLSAGASAPSSVRVSSRISTGIGSSVGNGIGTSVGTSIGEPPPKLFRHPQQVLGDGRVRSRPWSQVMVRLPRFAFPAPSDTLFYEIKPNREAFTISRNGAPAPRHLTYSQEIQHAESFASMSREASSGMLCKESVGRRAGPHKGRRKTSCHCGWGWMLRRS